MTNFPTVRLRRTRQNDKLRGLVRETRLHTDQLIYPLFVAEGISEPREISAMPGIMQWPLEHLGREVERIANLGIPAVLLFGIPNDKDEVGSQAYADQGIIQQAIVVIKAEVPDMLVDYRRVLVRVHQPRPLRRHPQRNRPERRIAATIGADGPIACRSGC